MDSLRIELNNAQQGRTGFREAWEAARVELGAGRRLVLTLRPASRSDDMNARLHATIADVAKQVPWAGAKRDVETWKRLLTAAWLRARGESLEILPAVDGKGVDIVFQRTSKLSQRDCGELVEFIYAWGVEQGVRFTAPEDATS